MPLVLAGILAAIGGVLSAVDTINTNDAELDRLDAEKKRVEEAYTKQEKQAEDAFNAEKDQAEKNKEEAYRQADNALLQADLADKSLNVSERALGKDFNTAIDNLYLSQANDLYSFQNAAMQAGSSTGSALASLSASGVRAGSSLSDAVLMESAVNAEQLQFSQDANRRSQNNNLAGVLNQLAGNRYGIMQNRLAADINRDDAYAKKNAALYRLNSFGEGGINYNLYQDQLDIMKTRKNQEINIIKEKKQDIWDNYQTQIFASLFTGASKGASTGYKAGTSFYEAVKYKD